MKRQRTGARQRRPVREGQCDSGQTTADYRRPTQHHWVGEGGGGAEFSSKGGGAGGGRVLLKEGGGWGGGQSSPQRGGAGGGGGQSSPQKGGGLGGGGTKGGRGSWNQKVQKVVYQKQPNQCFLL